MKTYLFICSFLLFDSIFSSKEDCDKDFDLCNNICTEGGSSRLNLFPYFERCETEYDNCLYISKKSS